MHPSSPVDNDNEHAFEVEHILADTPSGRCRTYALAMTTPPPPPEESPGTVLGAVARGGALMLRDTLLNGGVLLSLVVGVGGVLTRTLPWVWLGPVIGLAGVVVSFAGHRERVVQGPGGEARRTMMPSRAIWAAAIGVPIICFLAMAAMWGRGG